MVSHHPAKFGGHRHCGSGDIMLLVAEEENSKCSRFNPPYCLFVKDMGWKHSEISYYHFLSWSHTLKAAIGQNFEDIFCQTIQKHCRERKREKKNKERQLQSVLRTLHANTKTLLNKILNKQI